MTTAINLQWISSAVHYLDMDPAYSKLWCGSFFLYFSLYSHSTTFQLENNKISNVTQTIPCCCFLSGLNFNLKRIVWNDIWCFFFHLSCCALLPPEGATYWFELEMENIERSFKIDFHNYLNRCSKRMKHRCALLVRDLSGAERLIVWENLNVIDFTLKK